MDWEPIKFFVLMAVGGLLWLAGWLFGRGKSKPSEPDTKEKEKEASFKEGKAEILEKVADDKLQDAEKENAKADELLKEADKIRDEIEESKKAEQDLPKPVNHDELSSDEVNEAFKKKGY